LLFSLGILAVIGFQSRIKADFWKALFHAFLLSLCLICIFGVLLPVALRAGLSDMRLCVVLALIPFGILCPATVFGIPVLIVLWALYLGLMAVSLRGVRNTQRKVIRIIGQIVVLVTFGLAYAVAWYLTARAVAAAIATAAMMSGH